MKVIYDISVLGLGHYIPCNRAGIFRSVESVAYGLADSQECDLAFCAIKSFEKFQTLVACLDYLEANARLKEVPLPHCSSIKKIPYKKLHGVNSEINDTTLQLKRLLLKGIRKYLDCTAKAFEFYNRVMVKDYSYPIYPNSLAETDIFHSTNFPIPEQVKEAKHVKKILTIYDLIPILHPHFFEFDKNKGHFLEEVLKKLNKENEYVICISDATKNDLCNYLNISPSRVFVTPLAADSDLFYPCSDFDKVELVRKKYHIPNAPYILSLSTLEPRKNLDHAIKCFAKLVQQEHIKDLYFVLVGTKGWKYNKIFEEISNYDFLKDRIILTGYVADEDLAALYSGALAFVYPSFYEGFGLPPLEAMQCGIPVITSNTSSLPEVVGDAGIMLAPTDTDGLCQSILKIYNSLSLQRSMSLKSLEQAKQFSWGKCVKETISAYKTVLAS